jgi:hypothetical protein
MALWPRYAHEVQLNVHVPQDRKRLLSDLERRANETGRPKNQIVLDALEEYLHKGRPRARRPYLRTMDLGVAPRLTREEIYDDAIDHRVPSR